ncbi:MAG: DUF3160 domain-containing protein [Armatimonadetes bacterium]|nr:DUF3160 domain-containing protein [Armatimonadota bacterium]
MRQVFWILALVATTSAQPAANLTAVQAHLGPDAADLAPALAAQGFAVLAGPGTERLGAVYERAAQAGLPTVVTSDAMLHLWYTAQRAMQRSVEAERLLPATADLVGALWRSYRQQPGGAPEQEVSALAVAARLAGVTVEVPAALTPYVDATLARIDAAVAPSWPFGSSYRDARPLGAYADDPAAARYWRLTWWLANHRVPLAGGGVTPRSVKRAVWWCALLRRSAAARSANERLTLARRWLYGPADGLAPADIEAQLTRLGLDPEKLDDAGARRLSLTWIRGRLPRDGDEPSPFMAVVPRPAPPNAWLAKAVWRDGDFEALSGLQAAQAFGWSRAAELNADRAVTWPRSDSREDRWLALLGKLEADGARGSGFVATPAWRDKTLNTQMAAWVWLSHTTPRSRLPAAPAVTLPATGPAGFVEPLPEFWRGLHGMMLATRAELAGHGLTTPTTERWLTLLAAEAEQCTEDATRLAAGQPALHGEHWRLFSEVVAQFAIEDPRFVACDPGWREEYVQASGSFQTLVAQFALPGQPTMAAVGVVGSYHASRDTRYNWENADTWPTGEDLVRDPPLPPDWALSCQLDPDPATNAARRELRAAEADIHTGRAEAAIARLRAWQTTVRGQRPEVNAQLLIARAYQVLGRQPEAEAARLACRPMYGCPERDRAVAGPRGGDRDYGADARAKAAPWLAATEPRPGLSDEQEVARQDKRLRALVSAPPTADTLARLNAECPRSRLLPAGRLLCLVDWLVDHLWDRAPFPRRDGQAENDLPVLLDIERSAHGGLVGEVAAVLAAQWLLPVDPAQAMAVLAPYLATGPRAEPCPEAAEFLRGLYPEAAMGTARAYVEAHREALGAALLRHGQREAWAKLNTAPHERLAAAQSSAWEGPGARMDEPRAHASRQLVAWAASHEPDTVDLWAEAMEPECDPRWALDELARRFPKATTAPHAMATSAGLSIEITPWDLILPMACLKVDPAVVERLARAYPASRQGLQARAVLALRARDYTLVERLLAQRRKLPPPPWIDPGDRLFEFADDWFVSFDTILAGARAVHRLLPAWSLDRAFDHLTAVQTDLGREHQFGPLITEAGTRAPELLAALGDLPGARRELASRYPNHPLTLALRDHERGAGPSFDEACTALDKPGAVPTPALVEAVTRELAQGPPSAGGDAVLRLARRACRDHAGGPAETLIRAAAAETLIRLAWPEQALDLLSEATTHGGPFAARAAEAGEQARAQIALRDQPRLVETWRLPLVLDRGREQNLREYRPAALGREVAYVLTELDGGAGVTAIDRASGEVRWQAGGLRGNLAEAGGRLYVIDDSALLTLDPTTGHDLGREALPGGTVGPMRPRLLAAEPWLVFGAGQRLLGRAPGQPGWQATASGACGAVIEGGLVVATNIPDRGDGEVVAWDVTTGRVRWRTRTPAADDLGEDNLLVLPDHTVVLIDSRDRRRRKLLPLNLVDGTVGPALPADSPLAEHRNLDPYSRSGNDPKALSQPGGAAGWTEDGGVVYHFDPRVGRTVPAWRLTPEQSVLIGDEAGLVTYDHADHALHYLVGRP